MFNESLIFRVRGGALKNLGFIILLFASSTYAHDSYVSANRLHNAIRAAYPNFANSGFRGDCFSCHSNVPQIPATGFGRDIFDRTAGLFGNGNTTLSQNQLQTLVLNITLQNMDSDGDGHTNLTEFQAGSDPGDRNSTPVTATTSTTTTLAPVPTPHPPSSGDVTKLNSNKDPNANYLKSGGCGLSRREAQLVDEQAYAANRLSFLAFVLVPIVFAVSLRRRK